MRIVLIVWLELTAGSDARPFRQIPACGGMATLQNIGVQFTIRQKIKLKKKKIYLISQWKVPNNLALLFYIIIKHQIASRVALFNEWVLAWYTNKWDLVELLHEVLRS